MENPKQRDKRLWSNSSYLRRGSVLYASQNNNGQQSKDSFVLYLYSRILPLSPSLWYVGDTKISSIHHYSHSYCTLQLMPYRLDSQTREYIDWRCPLFVHSVMFVFLTQLADGGYSPTPFHFVYPFHSSYVVPSILSPTRLARYSYQTVFLNFN